MAAGLPVVTTPNAGLKDAIVDGREGFLLNSMPSNPSEITKKIMKLIENPNLMEKISMHNRIAAEKKYDARVISNQLAEMYKKILK